MAKASHRTALEFSKAKMKNPPTGRSITRKEVRIVGEYIIDHIVKYRFCPEGRANRFAMDWT